MADALLRLLRPAEHALPVPPESDRAVWGPGGTADRAAASAIIDRATGESGTDWQVALASSAARVHEDGNREEWESVVFERQHRLSRAAVAAALTGERRWLDDVLNGVWLLCEQSSWCWPAHDDAADAGSVVALPDSPFLDLGAGEVAAQLAWIDHLIGDRLERTYPGARARIRREVRNRVFEPFLRRHDWHWIGLDGDVDNWNPWIHGNVIVAALRLLDAPAQQHERAAIIAKAVEGIDRYVSALPSDGAIDEGYAYWWNGACRALEALDIVAYATAGVLSGADVPALTATVGFPHRCHLGGDWYLNLADGQAKPPSDQPWHALHRSALTVADSDAARHAASYRRADSPAATETFGLGRLLRGMTDVDWVTADSANPPLVQRVWLPSTEVLLARPQSGATDGLTVAVKGGHNGEHHNHNDVGSFVIASDGVPVVVDVGRPTYTRQTFGPGRYDIWTMQSAWHNTPVVNGHQQSPGERYRARGVHVSLGAESSVWSADIADAYPDGVVSRWLRRVSLADGRIIVRDQWDGTAVESAHWHLILAGQVTIDNVSARALVAPLDEARAVRIAWPSGISAVSTPVRLTDPMLTAVWGTRLTRLELDISSVSEVVVSFDVTSTSFEEDQ